MKMTRRNLAIVIVVVGVVVVGAVGWLTLQHVDQANYASAISAIYGQMQNTNQGFATYVAKADDFSALKAKAEECQKDMGNLLVSANAMGRGVPTKFVPFHKGIQALLNSYQSFYGKVAIESAGWNKSSFEGVETTRGAVLQSANTCFTNWPTAVSPLNNDTAWCGSLSSDLKKLAESKKMPAPSASPTVFVVGGVPMAGGIPLALPSIGTQIYYNPSAGYLAEMRSLLAGYRRLRGDLNRATEIYDKTNVISIDLLNQARRSRANIQAVIDGITPPPEFFDSHKLARDAMEAAVAAVDAFLAGDRWGRFHTLSEDNTGRMKDLQRVYGF